MGRLLELMERLLGLFLGTGGERAKVEATGISVIATNVGVVDAAADRLEVNADGSINVDGVAAILAKIIAAPATEATLADIKAAVEGILKVRQSTDATAYESVTITNSATALTAGTYGAATHAVITAETAPMRFRIDGTAPTASEGHLLNPGDTVTLTSAADIAAFRGIRTGATSGVIKVTYSGVV